MDYAVLSLLMFWAFAGSEYSFITILGIQFSFRALVAAPRVLLLDEPCYNQGPAAAKKILARIASWLDRHPRAAAVCVSHRSDQVPAGFNRVLDLGTAGGYNCAQKISRRKDDA